MSRTFLLFGYSRNHGRLFKSLSSKDIPQYNFFPQKFGRKSAFPLLTSLGACVIFMIPKRVFNPPLENAAGEFRLVLFLYRPGRTPKGQGLHKKLKLSGPGTAAGGSSETLSPRGLCDRERLRLKELYVTWAAPFSIFHATLFFRLLYRQTP